MIDGHGRTIDHLRLSVTSACNLKCLYCRPGTGSSKCRSNLSDTQRLEFIEYLYERRGLRQLRLTGGEPLLHKSIVELVARIRNAAPNLSLAMTTNGQTLSKFAIDLRRAGLDRLNISLDTLDPQRYESLAGGRVDRVIRGIDAAIDAGFPPPKLNSVVLRGYNDEQLVNLTEWAFERSMEIRFLEAMPIGPAAYFNRRYFVSASEIRKILADRYHLTSIPRNRGETATRFHAVRSAVGGTIGIIAPMSESFCGQCRRMRLTADGKLFPCLLDSRYQDISPCWQHSAFQVNWADELIDQSIAGKKLTGEFQQESAMVTLGG